MVTMPVGTEIDGYRVLNMIGRGGMGVVYEAEDVALSRRVALKMLAPELVQDKAFLNRLRTEARSLARLQSPFIVSIYSLRQTEAGTFIVMEYVDGGSLSDLIARGPVPVGTAVRIATQITHAIEAAHEASIIHRDIKPSNILLTSDGTVKVTDFGIAEDLAASNAGQEVIVAGTVQYMSPEQLRASPPDRRSDIYSAGMTLYQMLAGKMPFVGDGSMNDMVRQIMETDFPPPGHFVPGIPWALDEVVMKALAKDPSQRFQTASEMRLALAEAMDVPIAMPSVPSDYTVYVPPDARVEAPKPAPVSKSSGKIWQLLSEAEELVVAAVSRIGRVFERADSVPDESIPHVRNVSDQPTALDGVGFRPYVDAVADFLLHEDTTPPLTLSIEGPWGSGKTSFMLQLRERLEKGKNLTIWFNAWRHDREDSLWAAFSLEFVRQLRRRQPFYRRWTSSLRLLFHRYRWSDGWLTTLRAFALWVLLASAAIGIPVLIFTGDFDWITSMTEALSPPTGEDGRSWWQVLVVTAFGSGSVAAVVVFALTLWLRLRALVGNPIEIDLKRYLDAPDYKNHVSFIESFHADFAKVIEAYASGHRVFVFIDDLDRCQAAKVADLMQAINLLISGDPHLYFIVGMDREKVAASLAAKYKEVLPYLTFTNAGGDAAEQAASQAGLEYGYNFIEKFVQVPFLIPRPDWKDVYTLIQSYTLEPHFKGGRLEGPPSYPVLPPPPIRPLRPTDANGESSNVFLSSRTIYPGAPIGTDLPTMVRMEERLRQKERVALNSQAVSQVVLMVAPTLEYNLRRIKQFINLFRLRTYIASELGLFDDPFEQWLTLHQLGKSVAILLRWPLLLSDLAHDRTLLRDLHNLAVGKGPRLKSRGDARFQRWARRQKLLDLLAANCFNDEGNLDEERERLYGLANVDPEGLLRIAQDALQPTGRKTFGSATVFS